MFDWTGKNVLFASGFSGIGFQMMKWLMQKHTLNTLGIVTRLENVEMMKKLQAENTKVKVVFKQMNLMDKASIDHAVTDMGQLMGNIDVLVNCEDVLLDKDVETTIGVNLMGMINVTLKCMPYMDKSQMGMGGVVMNMSSVYGLEPAPDFAVYSAAKHGVIGFTRSMGDQHILEKTGIIFMTVCPGLTNSERMMHLRENVTRQHSQQFVDATEGEKGQSPEEVARQTINAIELLKNGSMWIVDKGHLTEAKPQMHW